MSDMHFEPIFNQDCLGIGVFEDYLDPDFDFDSTYEHVEQKLEREQLIQALSKLKKIKRNALVLKFGLLDRVYTQREIAYILGVDEPYCSRLISSGIEDLRSLMDTEEASNKARLDFVKMLFEEQTEVA